MILTCPLCHTRYLIAATLFDAGPRAVHCARCQHGWQASLTGEAAPGAAAPDPTLPAILLETAPLAPVLPSFSLPSLPFTLPAFITPRRVISAVSCLCAVLLLIWLVLDRQQIAQNRPLMEKLYNATGLVIYHFDGEGLSLEKVRSELRYDSGLMKLVVEGKIHNSTEYTQEIPNILATALGPDGDVLQRWQIDAPALRVSPGESMPFRSAINAPKGTVVDLNLSFSEIKNVDERDYHP